MNTEPIMGMCENCGYAYMGDHTITMKEGFDSLYCPHCHHESFNFDEESSVLALNESENLKKLNYTYHNVGDFKVKLPRFHA